MPAARQTRVARTCRGSLAVLCGALGSGCGAEVFTAPEADELPVAPAAAEASTVLAPTPELGRCWSETHPIAFISNQSTVFEWELYIMTERGERPTRLAQGQFRAPAWSPDGRSIAYRRYWTTSPETSSSEIGLIAPDGTQVVTLVREAEFEVTPLGRYSSAYGPTWSADGERLAFASVRGGMQRIWSISRVGGEPVELMPGFAAPHAWPRFSPLDAYTLAFVASDAGGDDIWFVDTRNVTTARRLTSGNVNGPEGLRWSPEGRRLAFSAEAVRGDAASREIYVLDVASGEISRITDNLAIDVEPAWSPDGQALLITSDRARLNQEGRPGGTELTDLWLVPIDAPETATRLTQRAGGHGVGDWSWNPTCD